MSTDKSKGASGYDVGYGKPPLATRFKKGQSGNPQGRPAGSRNFATTIQRALRESITVTENGRQKRISKLDAAIKQWVNRAVRGDARAMQQLLALAPLLDAEGSQPVGALGASVDQDVVAGILKRLASSVSVSDAGGASMATAQSNEGERS
jgi:hypothetical protein